MRDRVNVDFDPTKLVNILKRVDMNVKYHPPEFHDGQTQYAMLELTTTRRLQETIIHEINSSLHEMNGYEASLRVIDYGTKNNGKIHYAAEVVPFEDITSPQHRAIATQHFLHSLPRVVRNMVRKHPCK